MARRAVPINPEKLLEAAREGARHQTGPGRPRPVELRRAVSAAYYALFHHLALATAERLLPNATPEERFRLTRAFSHRDIRRVCEWVAPSANQKPNDHVEPIVVRLRGRGIARVAQSFCNLQEARHRADYDHLAAFSKATVLAHINDASRAIRTFDNAQARDREAFLSLIAMFAKP